MVMHTLSCSDAYVEHTRSLADAHCSLCTYMYVCRKSLFDLECIMICASTKLN
jgi:hypothetical protein